MLFRSVVDDDIPDCEEWEEQLYQRKVEVKETAWESYNSTRLLTVEIVQDDYKRGIRKVASDWTMNMPRDLYLHRYGTSTEKARLQGYLFVHYNGEYPFPSATNLGGRYVDSACNVPCTVAPSTLTHVGEFSFPYSDVYVHQYQGMTQISAYQDNHRSEELV